MDAHPIVRDDVTIMVKTLLRPLCLHRFVQSVRKYYPSTALWIADDSPEPYPHVVEDVTHCHYHTFPFDIGVGHCYNWMADRIQTSYIVTCEDDFIFTEHTRLEQWIPYIHFGLFDLMGGAVRRQRDHKISDFVGYLQEYRQGIQVRRVQTKVASRPFSCDVVLNWHVAKTATLRNSGWDPALKVARHMDFFLTAQQNGVRVGYHPSVRIDHDHQEQSRQYAELRNMRLPEFQQLFRTKWGIPAHAPIQT